MAFKQISSIAFIADSKEDLQTLPFRGMGAECYVIENATEYKQNSKGEWIAQIQLASSSDSGNVEITPQVQADWNQTDNTQVDYIKNKPYEVIEKELITTYETTDHPNIVEKFWDFNKKFCKITYNPINSKTTQNSQKIFYGIINFMGGSISTIKEIGTNKVLYTTDITDGGSNEYFTFFEENYAGGEIYLIDINPLNSAFLSQDILSKINSKPDWNQHDINAFDAILNKPFGVSYSYKEELKRSNEPIGSVLNPLIFPDSPESWIYECFGEYYRYETNYDEGYYLIGASGNIIYKYSSDGNGSALYIEDFTWGQPVYVIYNYEKKLMEWDYLPIKPIQEEEIFYIPTNLTMPETPLTLENLYIEFQNLSKAYNKLTNELTAKGYFSQE